MDLKSLGSLNQPATLKPAGGATPAVGGGSSGSGTAGLNNASSGSATAGSGASGANATDTRVVVANAKASTTATLAAVARADNATGAGNASGAGSAGGAGAGNAFGAPGSGAASAGGFGAGATGTGIAGTGPNSAGVAGAAPGAGAAAGSSIAAAIARAGANTGGRIAGALSPNASLSSLIANAGPLPGDPQKGIEVYLQMLGSLAEDQSHEKSAALLTTGLQTASAALRSAFYEAAFRLPPDLAAKDWKLSVSNGNLVFNAGQDELSTQDLADLRTVFGAPNVAAAAKQVAAVIISIVQMRKAGADPGSMAWVRFDVDESNFGDRVDLRAYTTATSPGSLYQPNPTGYSVGHSQVPSMLGGMDLRELVTARPKFLRADGSVDPEAVEDFELPPETPQLSTTLHGQCSCGQVRFILDNELEYSFYCHCSRCRARTGSAFASIGGITVDKLAVVAGHEHLLLEGECSDGYGARCSRCFSFLFAAVRGRQYLHVSLGTLLDSPSRVPDHHIFVGSKAPWYEITDSLPQYDELPDGKSTQ